MLLQVIRLIGIEDGPMRHPSLNTSKRVVLKRVEMRSIPVPREDSHTIILTTRETVIIECCRPNSTCFFGCFYNLLMCKPYNTTRLLAEIVKQLQKQLSLGQSVLLSPFNPGQFLLNQRIVDMDLQAIARLLLVHFCNDRA